MDHSPSRMMFTADFLFQVHLCEAFGLQDPMVGAGEYMMARRKSGPVLVSVKILRKNADERARSAKY